MMREGENLSMRSQQFCKNCTLFFLYELTAFVHN